MKKNYPIAKLLIAMIAGLILVLIPFYTNEFYLNLGIILLMNFTAAITLWLLMQMGKLSLGHAAFMGIGSYTSALLSVKLGVPFIVAFLASGIVAGLVGAAFGSLVLRLKGVYFTLVTFAFGEAVRLLFTAWVSVFGGPFGISNIPAASLFGFTFDTKTEAYFLFLVLGIVVVLSMYKIVNSPVNRVIKGINKAETLTQFLGVNTYSYKVILFTISSMFMGFLGSIYAHYLRFIGPTEFTFWKTVDWITINIIGGMGSMVGTLIGSLIIVPLPELLRGAVQFQRILYGLIIVLIILFAPQGLVGLWKKLTSKYKAAKSGVNSDGQ